MTYSQKLRDPRWQKLRLRILERDNWTCQSCRSTTKTLQVHHLYYAKRDPWDYPDSCYQTLCEDCHKTRHELTNKASDALRMSIRNVSTAKLEAVAQSLMENAMCDDPYRRHLVSNLHESVNLSTEGRGAIPDGIWSDLLASVLECQRNPDTAFGNWGVVKQMEMALEHLRKNGVNGEGK